MTVQAQLIGYPRIGPRRELKRALERAWSGRIERSDFEAGLRELRQKHLSEQRELVGSAVDDFFLYDEVLETAMMFGILPPHLAGRIGDEPFEVLTELSRGTPEREAWEMTKWFDTNYHYVVPEVGAAVERFEPLPWRVPGGDPDVAWTVLGPFSLVKLSKLGDGVNPQRLASELGNALWAWVRRTAEGGRPFQLQLDEPSLGMLLTDSDRELLDLAYADAQHLQFGAPPIVTVQFGRASDETLGQLGERGFAVQVPVGRVAELRGSPEWESQPEHVVSVLDGRSVWPDSFEAAEGTLRELAASGRTVRLVPSTSFMFLALQHGGREPAGRLPVRPREGADPPCARRRPERRRGPAERGPLGRRVATGR